MRGGGSDGHVGMSRSATEKARAGTHLAGVTAVTAAAAVAGREGHAVLCPGCSMTGQF